MSYVATFCTANLPANLAESAVPTLSIIRTPDQKEFEEWTPWPVHEFTTGFLGMSELDIIRFHQQLYQARAYGATGIAPGWVAVLDEDSARQSTVVLYRLEKTTDYWFDEGKDLRVGNFKEYDDGYFFWKWRMPASHIYTAVSFVDHVREEALEIYCHPELTGPDGIFDVAKFDKVLDQEVELPTWRKGMASL
ncbi:hypothetical protein MGYG_06490 [Nannizzia gypsea CBS 118893]|uniref:Uncharacterized protein n=1 Tax=Arthroderma gypseum (strain ATCC MYA-4604 / CBS 118893) TaxID=535722 RepID=E4UZG2_ARTGP|nr:hypothetical protein MGYG_06490 [Nannizzia gypsea CBS 118893]EFR03492.1 hypothetical protein MGYG_06490 [Nannizzia gypsea CBS 118893]